MEALMKKLVVLFLALGIVISISTYTYTYANSNATTADSSAEAKSTRIKGLTILSKGIIDVNDIKKHGYNTVFLQVDSIRNVAAPYNTNYSLLRALGHNIAALKGADLSFYICFMSGPGYSRDGKISTIYERKYEMLYFSQMVKEILKRYSIYKNFMGISIGIGNPNTPIPSFYKVQNNIIDNVRKNYQNLEIFYNLHPLSYEEAFKNLPALLTKNIVLNLNFALSGLSYPGYGAGYKTSLTLTKNAILQNLELFKEYQNKYDVQAVLTIETPWVKHTEILLQDLFEVFKMLNMDYNLHYGNSNDIYDISKNPSVLKVLDRHNE
jgi:hypothetical protein